jgi:hypothetical protein
MDYDFLLRACYFFMNKQNIKICDLKQFPKLKIREALRKNLREPFFISRR